MKKTGFLLLLSVTLMVVVGCDYYEVATPATEGSREPEIYVEQINHHEPEASSETAEPLPSESASVGCVETNEPSLAPEHVACFEPLSVQTSDLGRQVATDFIRQYRSTWSFGFLAYDGVYRNFAWEELNPRPLVVFESLGREPWVVYLDREGNRIENVPYIEGESFAGDFSLYDLDGSGIPVIVIRFGIPQTCASYREVFRFVDGEYRLAGRLKAFHRFFYDPDGRVIVMYEDAVNGSHFGYYFFGFNADGITHESVITLDETEMEQWGDHHWSEEFATNPTIFGTDIPLTPIMPLSDLQNEITEYLRATH